jgi:hypothetical protein
MIHSEFENGLGRRAQSLNLHPSRLSKERATRLGSHLKDDGFDSGVSGYAVLSTEEDESAGGYFVTSTEKDLVPTW